MYSYLGIVNDLLKEFPEISKNYAKEIAWIKDTFKGQETGGQTIYFDRCFCDYIGHLLVDECQDNMKIEYLRSWYLLQNRSEKLMLPETKKIFAHVKSYLQEPAQDVLPCFYI